MLGVSLFDAGGAHAGGGNGRCPLLKARRSRGGWGLLLRGGVIRVRLLDGVL